MTQNGNSRPLPDGWSGNSNASCPRGPVPVSWNSIKKVLAQEKKQQEQDIQPARARGLLHEQGQGTIKNMNTVTRPLLYSAEKTGIIVGAKTFKANVYDGPHLGRCTGTDPGTYGKDAQRTAGVDRGL